jgi:hypothetical protein
MKKWEILYYVGLGFLIFSLLLFQVSKIIYADYVTILFLIMLIILPILPKIRRVNAKGLEVELWSKKESEDIKREIEKVMPKEKFQEVKKYEGNLDSLIEELVNIGHHDFNYGLIMIRLRLEQFVRDIFTKKVEKKGKKRYGMHWNLRMMSKELLDNKIVDENTYELLKKVINACNRAVHGFSVNEENSELLYETAMRLIAYFYNLNEEVKKQKV